MRWPGVLIGFSKFNCFCNRKVYQFFSSVLFFVFSFFQIVFVLFLFFCFFECVLIDLLFYFKLNFSVFFVLLSFYFHLFSVKKTTRVLKKNNMKFLYFMKK